MASGAATMLHVDLDAFYASVEQLRRPELRGRPIAVGGGVVLAASYEARRFGVRSAMPLREARRRCPALIVVEGSFSDYVECSDRVFAICERFTPLVEQISIDEAFLDVSGATRLFGSPSDIAAAIRSTVRTEVGLPISAGVASTKFLAKIASRVAKPDGLVAVDPETEVAFLHALPVELMWGVGDVTAAALKELAITSIGDLAVADAAALRARMGRGVASKLQALAWNRDVRRVETHRRAGSVGAQRAFGGSERDPEVHRTILRGLADRVGGRMRRTKRAGRTVTVRVRFDDQASVTRSTTLRAPIATTEALHQVAVHLAGLAMAEASAGRGAGLLGISVSNLVKAPHVQLELPLAMGSGATRSGSVESLDRDRLDAAIDALRDRFGKDAVRAASAGSGRRITPVEFGDLAIPAAERRAASSGEDAEDATGTEQRSHVDPHRVPEGWWEAEVGEVERIDAS